MGAEYVMGEFYSYSFNKLFKLHYEKHLGLYVFDIIYL